jgi:hypothetical protein
MIEGLHKLYLACKQNSCFPGPLPEPPGGGDNNISIHTTLQCLGVIPNTNDFMLSSESQRVSEDQVFVPGWSPRSNEDATIRLQPKTADSTTKSLKFPSSSNEHNSSPFLELQQQDPVGNDGYFATRDALSLGPSCASDRLLNSTFSAHPVYCRATSTQSSPHLWRRSTIPAPPHQCISLSISAPRCS